MTDPSQGRGEWNWAVNRHDGLSKISGNGSQSAVNGNRIVRRSVLQFRGFDYDEDEDEDGKKVAYSNSTDLIIIIIGPLALTLHSISALTAAGFGFVVSTENNGQEPNYVSVRRGSAKLSLGRKL